MSTFPRSLQRTRTLLQLRVGQHRSIDVVLYVQDCDWWNGSDAGTDTTSPCQDKFQELLELLQTSIVPRWCSDAIERFHYTHVLRTKVPPRLGPGGKPVVVGETNVKTNQKRKIKSKATKKKSAAVTEEATTTESSAKRQKSVYYAMGPTLQVAYRVYDATDSSSRVLVATGSNSYESLVPLSKRIVAWCFPLTVEAEDTLPPDQIPFSSLFRAPPEEVEDVNSKAKRSKRA